MSVETIVLALSLSLGIVLLILIMYLISRVNELEAKAFSKSNTGGSKSKDSGTNQTFSGLSGRQLWDEWVGIANGGPDQYKIQGERDRFLALVEQHIRVILKAGIDDGGNGASDPPPNPLKVKMLRGEFESYIPSSQAERLFKLAQELAKADEEKAGELIDSVREVVDSISMALDAGSSLIEGALRDLSIPQKEGEKSREEAAAAEEGEEIISEEGEEIISESQIEITSDPLEEKQ